MSKAFYGNSGLSGVSANLPVHDSNLVRVVDEKLSLAGKKLSIVSPFTGKGFTLPMYRRNLQRLPIGESHAVFYDNSSNAGFQSELLEILKENFDSWTLIEDRNKAETLETVFGVPEYRRITSRVAAVYGTLYSRFVPSLPYVLNLEDDVEIPESTYPKLMRVMGMDDRVSTVIGNCRDRRPGYASSGRPIAFEFRTHQRTTESEPEAVDLVLLNGRSFGVHGIGAGHMGLWLTRWDAIDSVRIGEEEAFGIEGPDLVWGWRLKEAGRILAIDWSVDCRHWFQRHGRPMSV